MKKLVRDKIPAIIKQSGKIPIIYTADEEEFRLRLEDKLREEVEEYCQSKNTEELADILEVVQALANSAKINMKQLQKIQEEKRKKRGGFDKKIILEAVKKT